MRFFALLFAITGVVAAHVSGNGKHDWHAPVRGDVRSPCPALNSLANHGYIPRDGKKLSVSMVVKALGKALNVSEETATTLAKGGLRTSSDPASGTFSLEDLRKHNMIEHDASLSRKDTSVDGDNFSFNREVFDEFLSHFKGSSGVITIPAAAAARWARVETQRARNPSFTYSAANQFNSYGESALYLKLFRIPNTMTTSLEFVKIFFEQERLPIKEGWRPDNIIDGFSLASDILALAMNTPEKAPSIPVKATRGLKFFRSGNA